ncbi:hypothetical protein [Morganella morganii]|uniref:hypothetical protein n=1 Tax=Morganella morganii TaxID=582 RepID=UPI001BDAF0B2|nr:hypothetical protein [Morganella morganii]ELF0882806.1 hypothetical protein [Morganella morganii]MBT0387099.1 hypothetical protein [Morganella morganii subsp. morganii]MBT0394750.1 hypothetical protein [Morganella morganii subsp. morganii]MBT0459873.1 hypothetical protein [Morganella morganii subsp. morganii]
MKKILPYISLAFFYCFTSTANAEVFHNKCGYYVYSTAIENDGYYRFQLRDIHNNLYPTSNLWSFSASIPAIIELLNIAYISRTPVCISYRSYWHYWDIFQVSME